ncbi:6578_t:CDS:2, partial [Acaulospora colombiana]
VETTLENGQVSSDGEGETIPLESVLGVIGLIAAHTLHARLISLATEISPYSIRWLARFSTCRLPAFSKKLSLATLVTLLFASGEVYAHGHERSMHPREISSRQLAANKRHIQARNCAPQIAEYHRKRAIAKRNLLKKKRDTTFPYTTLAVEPQETTPEVTEGPYYLNNDLIRQDLRETQGGILLELDIGVIDTSTCEPLPNALVEIWNCNATGSYSGFTTAGGTGGGENPGGGNNSSMSFSLDPSQTGGGAPPSGSDSAVPSGTGGMAPGSGGGGGGGSSKTDDYNFLRGGWQTNDAGITLAELSISILWFTKTLRTTLTAPIPPRAALLFMS